MSDYFIGQIMLTGFNFAPRNFALCNGQLLPIAQNQALFSLLGVQYGGDGIQTFALPDLRGRVPLHSGAGYRMGDKGGAATVSLSSANLPAHTHRMQGTNVAGASKDPSDNLYANTSGAQALYAPSSGPQVVLAPPTLGTAGASQPHENMQPYEAISFAIALTGIYPSRS